MISCDVSQGTKSSMLFPSTCVRKYEKMKYEKAESMLPAMQHLMTGY